LVGSVNAESVAGERIEASGQTVEFRDYLMKTLLGVSLEKGNLSLKAKARLYKKHEGDAIWEETIADSLTNAESTKAFTADQMNTLIKNSKTVRTFES